MVVALQVFYTLIGIYPIFSMMLMTVVLMKMIEESKANAFDLKNIKTVAIRTRSWLYLLKF